LSHRDVLTAPGDSELESLRRRVHQLEAERQEHLDTIARLQVDEHRYRQLVENVRLIGWEYSRQEKRFTFVSHHAEEILGYTIEQWTQPRFWYDHLHPDDRDNARAFSHQHVDTDSDHEFEYRMIAADGTTVWFRDLTTVERDEHGRCRMHGVFIDITAQKRLEHALLEVTAAVSSVAGEELFGRLALHLARSLGLAFAHVSIRTDESSMTTLALCQHGTIIENQTLDIRSSPCEHVMNNAEPIVLANGVPQGYPGYEPFRSLKIESYIGVPVLNADNQTIGILAVADRKPIAGAESIVSLLNVFAARVAVELDRMQTERDLRESQQRLQTIAEHIPGVTYIYDKRGQDPRDLVFMGPGLAGLIGPDNAARVTQCLDTLFELVHPEDRAALAIDVADALRTKSVVHRNMRVRTDSGKYRWIRSASRPTDLGDGRVRWHVVALDIDRQARAEHVLQSLAEETSGVVGQDFFASLVERLARTLEVRHVLIARQLESGSRLRTLAFWSTDQLLDNVGFELLGTAAEPVARGECVCVQRNIRRAFPRDRLLRSLDASGFCGMPLYDQNGHVIGQLLLIHDGPIDPQLHRLPALCISASRASAELQRMHAEHALKRSQDHLRVMIEQMPSMMWTTDSKLVFTSSTGRGLSDIGFYPGQSNGQSIYEFFPDDEHGALAVSMHERALSGESVNYENTFARRSYQIHIEPLRDPVGAIIGTIGVALDISEHKEANRQLELLMRELDHRVRNNLATLSSIAHQTAAMTESVPEFVTSFTGRLSAMAMAHEVLAETRTGSVDLGAVLRRLLAPHVHDRTDRAVLDGPAVDLPPVVAFPLCLSVHELATNAAKHGAFANDSGRLVVQWDVQSSDGQPDVLRLSWREHDGPPVTPPQDDGFGTSVIAGLIRYQLRGSVESDFKSNGLKCDLRIPLRSAEHADQRRRS